MTSLPNPTAGTHNEPHRGTPPDHHARGAEDTQHHTETASPRHGHVPQSNDRPLQSRRALITGGSRGIGASCAIELARLGADIVITHRSSSDAAEAVLTACRAHGVTAHAVIAELGPDQPGQDIVDAAGTAAGDIPANGAADERAERNAEQAGFDIVIDNAPAPFPRIPLPDIDADDLADKARMDVAALHRLCTAYAPGMTARGYGRIIVISSGASWGATAPGLAAHGIAKAAQEAYVRYAATELFARTPITINALQLGFTATQGSSPVPPAAQQALAAATPAGRVGQPADIAGVVGLLAQPGSAWINGTALPVTGGMNYPLNLQAVLSLTHPDSTTSSSTNTPAAP